MTSNDWSTLVEATAVATCERTLSVLGELGRLTHVEYFKKKPLILSDKMPPIRFLNGEIRPLLANSLFLTVF